MKDFRINAENQIEFAEVGAGNLDFPEIIRAAEAAGCHFVAKPVTAEKIDKLLADLGAKE